MAISRLKKIHFIEFNARINTLAIRKVFPKYGTVLLASVLKEQGYDVEVFLEGVSNMRFDTIADCDVICLPIFTPTFSKVRECAIRIKAEKPDVIIIVGGPHVNFDPNSVLHFCDYAVRGEGDEVLPELLEALGDNQDISTIEGVSFISRGHSYHTPDRTPPTIPTVVSDLRLINGFKRASFGNLKYLNVQNTLQTSRGCQFDCKFCPTNRLFGNSFRNRDIDSIIKEIKEKKRYNDWFFVVDNSFFGNRKKAKLLLNQIIQEDLGISMVVFERHEIGRDLEMLDLMKAAGVSCLILGVESLDDDNLLDFNKKQSADKVIESIRNIKDKGIHVIASFAFGYDHDSEKKVDEIRDFIYKNDLSLNAFILHDTSQQGQEGALISKNRQFSHYYDQNDPNYYNTHDYWTGSFVTYFPRKMKPSTLQASILKLYQETYTHRFILKNIFSPSVFQALFGIVHGYGIRRMNAKISQIVSNHYMEHLRKIEQNLYDENETLLEEKLEALHTLPIPPKLIDSNDMTSNLLLVIVATIPGIIRYRLRCFIRFIKKQFFKRYLLNKRQKLQALH